ncbi:MAG: hypothetical protein ACRDQX_13595, partial [Pseudonocardiaceae bacterium]
MAIPWNALRERRALVIVAGAVLAVGLGTSAFYLGPGLFTHDQAAQATKTTSAAGQASVSARSLPAGFTEFRSDQGGFELAYPASWTKLS